MYLYLVGFKTCRYTDDYAADIATTLGAVPEVKTRLSLSQMAALTSYILRTIICRGKDYAQNLNVRTNEECLAAARFLNLPMRHQEARDDVP